MEVHYKEEISAYIDGELNDAEKEKLEKHLKECSVCRGYLDDLLQIKNDMKKIPMPQLDLDEDLTKKVIHNIRKKNKKYMKKYLLAAAGIVLCFIFIYDMYFWNVKFEEKKQLSYNDKFEMKELPYTALNSSSVKYRNIKREEKMQASEKLGYTKRTFSFEKAEIGRKKVKTKGKKCIVREKYVYKIVFDNKAKLKEFYLFLKNHNIKYNEDKLQRKIHLFVDKKKFSVLKSRFADVMKKDFSKEPSSELFEIVLIYSIGSESK